MGLKRALVLGNVSQDAVSRLSRYCDLTLLPQQQPSAEQLDHTQIIIVRSHVQINEKLIRETPELELVVRAGAGLDNVDAAALERYGVQLCHLGAESSSRSVAELAMAHTLHLLRQIGIANSGISRGEWLKPRLMGGELYERHVGVWGYGYVGQCIAKLFGQVGADIRVHNRSGKTQPFMHEPALTELSKWADVHVLALPHTTETIGLLSSRLLMLMADRKPIIVNVGRSDIADFPALITALESGYIAGLGIDPLEPDHLEVAQELAQRSELNTVFTPHLGSTTNEALHRMGDEIVRAVESYMSKRGL